MYASFAKECFRKNRSQNTSTVAILYVRQKQEKIALHGHKLLYYLIILIP